MNETPDAVRDLAEFALSHAIGSIIPEGGPLIPFALVERDGARSLHRFSCDRLEEMVVAGRMFVREQADADRVAFAWDGYITIAGVRTDALFVEASEGGAAASIVVAQRYGLRGVIRKRAHLIGSPVEAGKGSLFD